MTTGDFSVVVRAPAIAAVAAYAAASTPGVVRLEPGVRGLLGTVVRSGRQRWTGTDPAPVDGVRVRRTDSGLLVSVDITIAANGRATEIGRAVQERIVRTVRENTGRQIDEVRVCILDIEPGQ